MFAPSLLSAAEAAQVRFENDWEGPDLTTIDQNVGAALYLLKSGLDAVGGGINETSEHLTLHDTQLADLFDPANGYTGWVFGSTIPMTGAPNVDVSLIPIWANDIMVRIQGMSTNNPGNLAAQFLDGAGVVITATDCFTEMTTFASSTTTATTTPAQGVSYIGLTNQSPAANFASGFLRLKRTSGDAWLVDGRIADTNRHYVISGNRNTLAAVRGVRLGMVGATFDGGVVSAAWRR